MQGKHGGMMGAPEVVQYNMNMLKLLKAKKMLEIGAYIAYQHIDFFGIARKKYFICVFLSAV